MTRLRLFAVLIVALGLLLSSLTAEAIFGDEIATQDNLWRLNFR